jgi:hypothetical protein
MRGRGRVSWGCAIKQNMKQNIMIQNMVKPAKEITLYLKQESKYTQSQSKK